MRLVLDTNVLVSAALKRNSIPAEVVDIAAKNQLLLKSEATEGQLFDVVARPYFASLISEDTRTWLRTLLAKAEAIAIIERIVACRDPTDDKFLELGVNGNADVIVSGDADLLALDPFRGISVVAPAEFLRRAKVEGTQ